MMNYLHDHLPAILMLSPITLGGLGIGALALVMYLISRTPEYLLILLTALFYSIVPLIPKLI